MKKSGTNSVQMFAAAAVAGIVFAGIPRRPRLRRDQVAIITGGSSGLGLALAHRFGKAGLKLVLTARDGDRLQQARHELLAAGSVDREENILIVPGDISQKEQAPRLIDATVRAFGTVDVLINNAGIIEVGPMEDQPLEAYERAMGINFFGAVYATYATLPIFFAKKAGAIVNIASIGGKVAVPHLLPYVTAKFALTGFSEGLHAELRQKGIRVTTVCPGLMRTGGESHAIFQGQIEKEKAWFQTSARTPLLSASVEHAAGRIFSAVNRGRAEITITPQAWLAARFAGLAPETTQFLNAIVNAYALPAALQSVPEGSLAKAPAHMG